MAKDMLNAIYEAEEESKQRIAQAKALAEQNAKNAELKAQELAAQARADAEVKAKQMLAAVEAEGKAELDKAKLESQQQCKKLSQTAEKNRSKVIQNVVDMLTN